MARTRRLVCAVLFFGGLTLAGCATANRPAVTCPLEPASVPIQATPSREGKVDGYFVDRQNFVKLLTSLQKQKAYTDSLKSTAIGGGCSN